MNGAFGAGMLDRVLRRAFSRWPAAEARCARLRKGAWVLALALPLLAPGPARAAGPYPLRPVTLVVPFPQGSDSDLFARNFAQHLPRYLGDAEIRLSYREGASGTVGAALVRAAPADGYTLLEGRVSTQIIAPLLDQRVSYRWRDFTVLAVPELVPLICAVRAEAPYQSARDLLGAIRRQPGRVRYASSGRNTVLSFAAQYLLHLGGLKPDAAEEVVVAGGPQATAAVLGGQADFVCNNAATLIPHIQAGRLRGLFSTAPARLPALPQVPNAREAGVRDMGQIMGWTALVGPPGLPREVVTRWRTALGLLAQDASWQAGVVKLGGLPALRLVTDPERFMRQQERLYEELSVGREAAR